MTLSLDTYALSECQHRLQTRSRAQAMQVFAEERAPACSSSEHDDEHFDGVTRGEHQNAPFVA